MKPLISIYVLFALLTACDSRNSLLTGEHQHQAPTADEHAGHGLPIPDTLYLEDQLRTVANIRTQVAQVKPISTNRQFTGTVALNERTVQELTARVPGRIEKLFFRSPGTYIEKGQVVYGIYSESLMSDMASYVAALNAADTIRYTDLAKSLTESARRKLIVLGLSDTEINRIRLERKVPAWVPYFSPFGGYVSDLYVKEGEYVQAGSPVLRLADLNTVWVETIVYAQDIPAIRNVFSAQVSFEEFSGEVFTGKFVYHNPSLEPNQKVSLVRIQITNPSGRIKPGMMANVQIAGKQKTALVIPKSALITTAGMVMVWVDTGKGVLERRRVETGLENAGEVEIRSGIEAGEQIIKSGAYLLNSEFILRRGANTSHQH
ncbi:hypothetical protein GCM10023189_45480 [Nibrella saemangeumensis]|uniref:Efflux RND transporter periplasmic adaptor subunit n=1 Tax=Nibrella saemangeumensis TaxID=1084526 RepID=A0ABP8NFY4_9BACT